MTQISLFKIGFTVFMISSVAYAASPSKDFLKLEACGFITDGLCTLDELVTKGFNGSDLKWEEGDEGTWILRVVKFDKLTKQKSNLSIVFEKSKDSDGRDIAYPKRASTQGKNAFGQDAIIEGEAIPVLHSTIVAVAEKISRKDSLKEKKREEAAAALKKASEADSPQKTDLLRKIQGVYTGSGPTTGKYAGKDNQFHVSKVTGTDARFSLYCFEKERTNNLENQKLDIKYFRSAESDKDWVIGTYSNGSCKIEVQFSRTDGGPPSATAMFYGPNCCATILDPDIFSHQI